MSDPYNLLKKFVTPGNIEPEFSCDFYRLMHDDLLSYSDAFLAEHYEKYGRTEGRLASPAAHRVGFVAMIPRQGPILEIGPFNRPTLIGENVRYFDVLDTEQLVERAKNSNLPSDRCPKIDYVSAIGDLSVVEDRFDSVFSSHCIEHQPDLVRHLNDVARLLNPGGHYYLAIPDKRYCFDHFIALTEPIEIIRAHEERRLTHSFKSVYEHAAMTTHNDELRHWQGDHTDPRLADRAARAEYALQIFTEANGAYIDVHAWQFTPNQFRICMAELIEKKLVPFELTRVYDTPYGRNEFMAILSPKEQ